MLLGLALVAYLLLAALTVTQVGVVGEVDLVWALGHPPDVVTQWEPRVWADGPQGVLQASQVRPIERLHVGPLQLPIAVNSYTGAVADWPAWLLYRLTQSTVAVRVLLVGLGAGVLIGTHRVLKDHGPPLAAGIAALVLATDWTFVFYRKVLGGTELMLQGAALLLLAGFWGRRWSGGRRASTWIAVAVGLGLLAKATFVATLIAFALAALLTRWDRPATKAPADLSLLAMAGVVLAITSPLWGTWLHHALWDPTPAVQSHDFVGLQVDRALSGLTGLFQDGPAPARETPQTLAWFLGNPLPWFEVAYGASAPRSGLVWLRLTGGLVLLLGSGLAWARRRADKHDALLRFLSVFVPLQLTLIWLANRDLHHLAQAAPTLAVWFGLAASRIVDLRMNRRNPLRAIPGVVLSIGLVVPGVWLLAHTDGVIKSTTVPQFVRSGQADLVTLLRRNGVESVVACDYDAYGMLDILAPEIHVTHGWGAASHTRDRDLALEQLLHGASGSHLLILRPSAPMIYTVAPSEPKLQTISEALGLDVVLVDALEDADGPWARLYRVQ